MKALSDKEDAVGVELASNIQENKKKLSVVVDLMKAYKGWGKKANDAEFITEVERLLDFAKDGDLPIELSLPKCLQQDMIEVTFVTEAMAWASAAHKARAQHVIFGISACCCSPLVLHSCAILSYRSRIAILLSAATLVLDYIRLRSKMRPPTACWRRGRRLPSQS